MITTIEQKKASAAIFAAAANGQQIQWSSDTQGWVDCDPFDGGSRINVLNAPQFYRIKPEPVSRPWSKPSDVPPLCWIRWKGGEQWLVSSVSNSGIKTAHSVTQEWDRLSEEWGAEHSTDRKTWKPCTVTE
jgi:hypothetical protein